MQNQWPLRNVFLLPRSPQLGEDTVRDKVRVLFKLFSFIRALLLWVFGKGCFYWCSLLLGLQCKQPASATIRVFFWALFRLTLHSFSKGILVNLWNTKVWFLWNFNSVKYFFKTGDSKMKAEQAPLPTQTGFFLHFQMFLLLVAIGTLKSLSSAWSVTQTGDCSIFLFQRWGIFKIIEGNKKENEKQNQNNFDVIDFTVAVWKGNRKKRRKSLSVYVSWICQVSHLKVVKVVGFFLGFVFCFCFFLWKILIYSKSHFSLKYKF